MKGRTLLIAVALGALLALGAVVGVSAAGSGSTAVSPQFHFISQTSTVNFQVDPGFVVTATADCFGLPVISGGAEVRHIASTAAVADRVVLRASFPVDLDGDGEEDAWRARAVVLQRTGQFELTAYANCEVPLE